MIARGDLPNQLQVLLSHPNILKAGRLVDADLKFLEAACKPRTPFVGGLELAKYAKDRRIISSAKCSLADLCAVVLGKHLNKNVPERISQEWKNEVLTKEQEMYAALDAYASLRLYEKLSTIEVPQPLSQNPHPATPVLVYSSDNTTVIARGVISIHMHDRVFDGINITSTRIVVDVLEVFVPGALITTHRNRALLSFGNAPFSIICLRSHLRVFSLATWKTPSASVTSSINLVGSKPRCNIEEPSFENTNLDYEEVIQAECGPSLGDIVTENDNSANLPELLPDYPRNIDRASAAEGQSVFTSYSDTNWDSTIRSRVIKDAFHVFNMFRLPSNHGLRLEFGRQLRDAIFIPDAKDRLRVNAWGTSQSPPQNFEKIRASRPEWLWRQCRRTIPPPKNLYPLVEQVFRTFGPLKDAATGMPLFNSGSWKTAKHVLDLIRNGFLSDPPGISLYTIIGIDKKAGGLPIYRCARGTNFTEGGVHAHLRSHLPSSGASIQHMHACLLDFILRHNLLVRFFPQKID
jgi:3'-5' exonuclease